MYPLKFSKGHFEKSLENQFDRPNNQANFLNLIESLNLVDLSYQTIN